MKDREPQPIFDRSGGVPGGAPWEREWVEYEETHLDRPKRKLTDPPLKPARLLPTNRINRQANIDIAHGCWINGVYRDNGIPRPSFKRTSKSSDSLF